MKIAIASKNPVKINAVKEAFKKVFPESSPELFPFACPSQVRDQPMGEAETLKGALNRLELLYQFAPQADFFASIEGGIIPEAEELAVFAWIVLAHQGEQSRSKTASFYLPPALAKLVKEGKELGEADDIVFARKNSKQGDGTVGILTNQLITRTDYYEHAVILALSKYRKLK